MSEDELLEAIKRVNSLGHRIMKLEKRKGLTPAPATNIVEQLSIIHDMRERERVLSEYVASLEARVAQLEAARHE